MIRVGIPLGFAPDAWLGGAHYFRSLFAAVATLPEPRIELLGLVSRRGQGAWAQHLPGQALLSTALLDRWHPAWALRKAQQRLGGGDPQLAGLLRRNGVAVQSHGSGLGPGAGIPTLGWIPDFQHRHLPEFFSRAECRRRDSAFRRLCRGCEGILVSSADARRDLAAFDAASADRAHVLHFVPVVPPPETLPGRAELEARYGFSGPYLYLPNQFWRHKNHKVVVEALALLQAEAPLVLATGNPEDFRQPGYFLDLMAQVRRLGLETRFRVLGVVPHADVLGLMVQARAVLNPSLFEGWSTTVEEAKALGAQMLLSDLPVHREQAPAGGIYFNPRSAESLAEALRGLPEAVAGPGPVPPLQALQTFGAAFQSLVLGSLETFNALQRSRPTPPAFHG